MGIKINSYKIVSHVERLRNSNVISLDKRRLRGNFIKIFKMSKDVEAFKNIFKLNNVNC